MNRDIVYESEYIVQLEYNNVVFTIEKGTGILLELSNYGPSTDIVIPHIFPSGHRIQCLASNKSDSTTLANPVVGGSFNKITISDKIFVGCNAFIFADVKEVVWNDCPCIPRCCFSNSHVEKVTNIANVNKILEYAFHGCRIKEFTWPDNCKSIPKGCFKSSQSLGELNNIKHIESIEKEAFVNTGLSKLDLSGTEINCLSPGSLCGLPKACKIIPSYYVSDEEFVEAVG